MIVSSILNKEGAVPRDRPKICFGSCVVEYQFGSCGVRVARSASKEGLSRNGWASSLEREPHPFLLRGEVIGPCSKS